MKNQDKRLAELVAVLRWYADALSNYADGVPGTPMDVDDDSGFDWEQDNGERAFKALEAFDGMPDDERANA